MKDHNSESSQLEAFRSTLSTNSRLNDLHLDDTLLIKFLRCRNYDVTQAMTALTAYVDIINKRSDLFSWTDEIKKVVEAGIFLHYPERTPDGCVVNLVTPGKWNPSDFSYTTYIKLAILWSEVLLLDEDVQKNGFIVVIDMSGIKLTHIYHTGVSNAKLFSDLTERILPRKLASIHFVNASRFQDAGLALFKPFMTASTKQVMHFHSKDCSTLHKFVPPNLLPASLGGYAKEVPASTYIHLLEKNKEKVFKIWDQLRN